MCLVFPDTTLFVLSPFLDFVSFTSGVGWQCLSFCFNTVEACILLHESVRHLDKSGSCFSVWFYHFKPLHCKSCGFCVCLVFVLSVCRGRWRYGGWTYNDFINAGTAGLCIWWWVLLHAEMFRLPWMLYGVWVFMLSRLVEREDVWSVLVFY